MKKMASDQTPDPLAGVERGDDDPIAYDDKPACGATVLTYPGESHRVECLRDPHPPHWVHVSACDDEVDYVWRDVRTDEIAGMVITDEGVMCRGCGHEITTKADDHFVDCPVVSDARS